MKEIILLILKRELDDLSQNLNEFSQQQIENLKVNYTKQNEILSNELSKMKNLMEVKNSEI